MKILFVCRGNVARSQYAEAIFKRLNNRHEILSAGTRVIDKEGKSRHGQALKDLIPGGENVLHTLRQKGIEVSESTRTQLNPEMVEWADIIVTMAEPSATPDYLSHSHKAIYWEVEDPKGKTLEVHRFVADEIESLLKGFIAENDL